MGEAVRGTPHLIAGGAGGPLWNGDGGGDDVTGLHVARVAHLCVSRATVNHDGRALCGIHGASGTPLSKEHLTFGNARRHDNAPTAHLRLSAMTQAEPPPSVQRYGRCNETQHVGYRIQALAPTVPLSTRPPGRPPVEIQGLFGRVMGISALWEERLRHT